MSKYLLIPLLFISTFDFGPELFQKATSQDTRIDSTFFYKSINVSKAYKIIKENINNSKFVILDVRKPDDFRKEHIANAINIDFKSDNFSSKLDSLDKSKTYLINCYGGFRSKSTMGMMEKKGFAKLYNMKGGIIKWRAKKLPLVTY
ncbi:MAG: rhodanese-like domain-containing protein [Bacteroidales bacterium]|nr:MAG: rhodanese-like domain-containing protein [Bacteroidales bacterium]